MEIHLSPRVLPITKGYQKAFHFSPTLVGMRAISIKYFQTLKVAKEHLISRWF